MRRIEYKENELIGDNGIVFLKELQPKATNRKRRTALFLCNCGHEFEALIDCVKFNGTKSCGCKTIGWVSSANTTHGNSKKGKVTTLYNKWCAMKQRCTDKNNKRYMDYGGRGITVCDEWTKSFEAFEEWAKKNGYRDDLELDRINNNEGYRPDNCRFVTRQLNCRNRRVRRDSTLGISGVTPDKYSGKYRVRINLDNKKRKSLGNYSDFFEACCVRKSAENKYWKNKNA